jgi:imidazolonepropionase-like amidohydrolase
LPAGRVRANVVLGPAPGGFANIAGTASAHGTHKMVIKQDGQTLMQILRTAAVALLLQALPAHSAQTAFINVNVIPMTSEVVVAGQTVIVEGGRIVTIGDVDTVPIAEGTLLIDGTDRYLMPGLAEMHAHIPRVTSPSLDRVLSLNVVNGVTMVRGMLGRPSHLELRQDILSGKVFGPRLFTSGPSFNGNSVSGPASAAEMVRAQHGAGYDFLKIHPGLTRAEFDALASTANRFGMQFSGHVSAAVGVPRALAAGMASIDHLDGYMQAMVADGADLSGGTAGLFGVLLADRIDEEKIAAIAAETAAAGVWNVPTESSFEHWVSDTPIAVMRQWPEMRYMSLGTIGQWAASKQQVINDPAYDPAIAAWGIDIRRKLILALHEAGAGLLLGSDAPQVFNVPGFAIHRELAYLVAAGLTPYESLQTGTVNPAVFFGQERVFGSVETGKEADLVLLDANPLEDIGNASRIHGVMLRDRWLPRQELDEILASFERQD